MIEIMEALAQVTERLARQRLAHEMEPIAMITILMDNNAPKVYGTVISVNTNSDRRRCLELNEKLEEAVAQVFAEFQGGRIITLELTT